MASGIVKAMIWAAQGKTVHDTATILNLSSDTVESDIKQAGQIRRAKQNARCCEVYLTGIIDI